MTVSVAIDLALDRLFDYEVPEALEKKLAPGQLLSVPFGHREAQGFAMEVIGERGTGNGERKFSLKPITAIVDEKPFFSAALLEVVRKVAAYTAAPVESVLRAAVPAAVLKRKARPRELLYIEPAVAVSGTNVTERQQWLYEQITRLGGGWMAQLCKELGTSPGTIRQLALLGLVKVAVRERRRNPLAGKRLVPTRPLPLNDGQKAALDAIMRADRPVLLYGITGSGKTEVYLQAIAAVLEEGRGAIVLVPEISLTPQTAQRFASRFGKMVAVMHSGLSDGERYDEWHRIRSGEARIVIGSRSAVWAPVANLGLVVVDEEHDTSYKQEDSPRYHARDVAVLRGCSEGARVVLGSATPSLESWMNARRGKYVLAEMPCRAGKGSIPNVHLVDTSSCGGAMFSRELLDAISLRLDRGEQTMLFLNRRGYSSSVVCENCGFVLECPECGLAYTYHRADSCLRCHICGRWREPAKECPSCGSAAFHLKGVGTQRAEAALRKCFPRASILRMDADSTSRRNSHDDILSAFRRGEADILIGTQMIAKGLDFPNVTLVGALNADASLNMPDFRAAERTYQLLAQVSGRAGRAELPGEVFIQSRDPSSPVFLQAAAGDFAKFAEVELKERERCFFPPFCHLASVTLKSRSVKTVGSWADMYAKSLQAYAARLSASGGAAKLVVSDAMPSAMEKADGWYRWQIVLRSRSNMAIVNAWRWIVSCRPPPEKLRIALDADAIDLV